MFYYPFLLPSKKLYPYYSCIVKENDNPSGTIAVPPSQKTMRLQELLEDRADVFACFHAENICRLLKIHFDEKTCRLQLCSKILQNCNEKGFMKMVKEEFLLKIALYFPWKGFGIHLDSR